MKHSRREEPGLGERMFPLLLHQECLSARSLGGRNSERWAHLLCDAVSLYGSTGRCFPGYSGNEKQEVPLITVPRVCCIFFLSPFLSSTKPLLHPQSSWRLPHISRLYSTASLHFSANLSTGTIILCHQNFMSSETFSCHRALLQTQS